MAYRGRHRRRRKGRALRASLAGTALALTVAAGFISTSQAASSDNPGGLTAITSSAETDKLQLRENLADADTLGTLENGMGGNVGVDGVLKDANHSMRDKAGCAATEKAALPAEPAATRAYCWEDGDAQTQKWLPRSVTTSGDSDEDGRWGSNRVILSGWTHNDRMADTPEEDKGLARVAFIDANDPDNLKYRWVLLVAPLDGGKDFEAVRSRIGGMVWYQDKLIVTAKNGAAGDNALFVFDMNRILRADVVSDEVGKVKDGWSAHRYRYVMPAMGSYSLTGGACDATTNDEVPCLASVSLDRTSTPDSLVANEWFRSDSGEPARVWRYDYSTASDRTGLLAVDSGGRVNADEAYETEAVGLRGVLSHRPGGASEPNWYGGHAPDAHGKHGTLWRQNESTAKAAKCGAGESYACWGQHTESMSYWQETGELWTLTGRTPNHGNGGQSNAAAERVLYAVPLSSVDRSLE
ncbi:hypothetical protein G5C60_16635 [Streptomyces sp. HC44]|uniref:Secreted protein n=1 Tax=Streptomyces scabichelini TaxID=2711217 RepID=A0A6G4V530_9ACTN|nr:hypothetical protein [Streptomyces scabichelini]NGO09182.1 hypothetical protein [Streptomyces scabichelini]